MANILILREVEAERTEGLSAERDAREMNLRVSSVQKGEKEVSKAIKSIEEIEAELSKQKTAAKELKDASKTVSTNRQKVCICTKEGDGRLVGSGSLSMGGVCMSVCMYVCDDRL